MAGIELRDRVIDDPDETPFPGDAFGEHDLRVVDAGHGRNDRPQFFSDRRGPLLEIRREPRVGAVVLPAMRVVLYAGKAHAQRLGMLHEFLTAGVVVENRHALDPGRLQSLFEGFFPPHALADEENRRVSSEGVFFQVLGEHETRRTMGIQAGVVSLEQPREIQAADALPVVDPHHPRRHRNRHPIAGSRGRVPGAVFLQQRVDRAVYGDDAGAGRAGIAGAAAAHPRNLARLPDAVGAAHHHLQQRGVDHPAGAVVVPQFRMAPRAPARPLVEVDMVGRHLRPLDLFRLHVQIDLVGVSERDRRQDARLTPGTGHDAQLSGGDFLQRGVELPLGLHRVVDPNVGHLIENGVPLAGLVGFLEGGLVSGFLLGRLRRGGAPGIDPPVGRPTPAAEGRIGRKLFADGRDVTDVFFGLAFVEPGAHRQSGIHIQQDRPLFDAVGPITGEGLLEAVFQLRFLRRRGQWISLQPVHPRSGCRWPA